MSPLKYARIESERRFLVAEVPEGAVAVADVHDYYIIGTRLRLREVTTNGVTVRKLGQKIRLGGNAERIAHTTIYLDDTEWATLSALKARRLHKRRHHIERDAMSIVVDEHDDGTLIAELDGGDERVEFVPDWLAVIREVTNDEHFTGIGLSR
jgi:CYTH domain-containing protein